MYVCSSSSELSDVVDRHLITVGDSLSHAFCGGTVAREHECLEMALLSSVSSIHSGHYSSLVWSIGDRLSSSSRDSWAMSNADMLPSLSSSVSVADDAWFRVWANNIDRSDNKWKERLDLDWDSVKIPPYFFIGEISFRYSEFSCLQNLRLPHKSSQSSHVV